MASGAKSKLKSPRQILSSHLASALAYEAVGKLTEAREAGEKLVRSLLTYGLIDPNLCAKLAQSLPKT